MLDNYDLRLYDLAKVREQEIVESAEMARLLKYDREPAGGGVLRHLVRVAKDALAPKGVRIRSIRVLDGDVLA